LFAFRNKAAQMQRGGGLRIKANRVEFVRK